jgi:hypothetical protein
MEEARQHSALTTEQRVLVAVHAGGMLAILVGIVGLFIDPRIFWIGAMSWAASKIVGAAWPLLRPEVTVGEAASKWHLMVNLTGGSAIFLGLYFFGGLK